MKVFKTFLPKTFLPLLANLRLSIDMSMDPAITFALDPSRKAQVSAFGKPPVAFNFTPAFHMQITPSLPAGWPVMRKGNQLDPGSVFQTETGNAIVCDDLGTIMQAGPYSALFLRLPSVLPVAGSVQQKEEQSLKTLIESVLKEYSESERVGAMYVTMHEIAHFLPGIASFLISRGFSYHHYGASFPRGDSGSRNEHIYYKWCRCGAKDMVPAYATSIEGAAAVLLSPDETMVLLVKVSAGLCVCRACTPVRRRSLLCLYRF
jgi:hypothetical protein